MTNNVFLSYLNPLVAKDFPRSEGTIGSKIHYYNPQNESVDIRQFHVAIMGIPDGRSSRKNKPCALAPNVIRKYFYQLYNHVDSAQIIDMGNIKPGGTVEDTYTAVKEVVAELLRNRLFVLILGGSNDMILPNYYAYESFKRLVDISCIDSRFDIGRGKKDDPSMSYVSKIVLHEPSYIFNFTNIGYQSYYVDKDSIELIDSLLFDSCRLGIARTDLTEVEPAIRKSDIVGIDISAVRAAYAPGNAFASPNGFDGEEICALTRYAGISSNVSSLGIYEYNPSLDIQFRTAKLIAQMLWYFIDGYYMRINEYPYDDAKKFIKYYVMSTLFEHGITFYKSKQTGRWWMEVECPDDLKERFAGQFLTPCSYNDYLVACRDEVPDRWMRVYRKLMR